MNDILINPKMGLRFSLVGSEYEVVFVHAGIVRYSAKAGGKIYRMSLEKFNEKYSLGEIQRGGPTCLNN